jgi:hypothetical protein
MIKAENPNTQVVRVKADSDGGTFIIKTTRDDHPPVEITERLNRECYGYKPGQNV